MIGLDDLCMATGGQLYGEAISREFTGISADPALVKPGDLFIVASTPESGQDAEIAQALAAGAGGLLCEEPPSQDVTRVTTVLVGDARLGLEQWTAFVMRQYHPLTIGVIGSLGKTSVCDAIGLAMGSRYPVYVSARSHNGPYQLALDVANLEPQHVYAVFELKPDAFATIGDMMSILQPQILVISSPLSGRPQSQRTPAVIPEGIAQAVSRLPARGTIVANVFDRELFEAARPDQVRLLTYGESQQPADTHATLPDVAAAQIHFALDSVSLDVRVGRETTKLRLPGTGSPSVNRFLAAIAVCLALDFPLRDAFSALSNGTASAGARLVQTAQGALLLDNSSGARPETALALLDWVGLLGEPERRRYLVLGDFDQRGDAQVELCHEIGRRAAAVVDSVAALHESTEPVVLSARRSGVSSEVSFLSHQRADAAEFIRANVGQGDLVIVLGSHKDTTETLIRMLTGSAGETVFTEPRPALTTNSKPIGAGLSWLEIDLKALQSNVATIKRQLQNSAALMVVVRDDGYRHGLVEAARAALGSGAELLAVGTAGEGCALREAGIDSPTLVMGYATALEIESAISAGLSLSIQSRSYAGLVAHASRRMKTRALCHIRVSGASRDVGVPLGEAVALVRELKKADQVILEGLFIEFSPVPGASWASDSTRQLQQFAQIARTLAAAGVEIPYIHAAGSAAMLTIQNSIFSVARVGHLAYGIAPFSTTQLPAGLKPALMWKTTIVDLVIEIPKRGTQNPARRLAVIPLGYRDGLVRSQRSPSAALISGSRAPLTDDAIGPDWSWVDTSSLPSAVIGDEVVLIGAQGNSRISLEEIAAQRGCAPYDVLASLPVGLHREFHD